MICNVTGVVQDLTGTILASTELQFFKQAVLGQNNATVLPDYVSATTNEAGEIEIDLQPGDYVVVAVGPQRATQFEAGIPDQASAVLNECISQASGYIVPDEVQDAREARDKAEEWAENPEDDPVEAGQFSAKHWAAKAEAYADTYDAQALATAVAATGADRQQTGLDRNATAADVLAADADRVAALAARAAAEVARDSSFANAKGAATIAAARALVADNETFIVYAAGATEYTAYRRLTSTTQVELGTYPAKRLLVGAFTTKIGRKDTPITGTSGDTKTYCIVDPATHDGFVTGFKAWCNATGTIKLKVWGVSGNVYTQKAEVSLTVSSTGLNEWTALHIGSLPIAEGDVIAVRGSATGVFVYSNGGPPNGGGYFSVAGDATGATGPSISTNVRLEQSVEITNSAADPTGDRFRTAETTADRVASLLEQKLETLGQASPATGLVSTNNFTFIRAEPVRYDCTLTEFAAYFMAAGTTTSYLTRYSGNPTDGFVEEQRVALPSTGAGLKVFSEIDDFHIQAGQYVGLVNGSQLANSGTTDLDGGHYQKNTTSSPVTGATYEGEFALQWRFKTERYGLVDESRIDALEDAAGLNVEAALLAYGDSMTAGQGGTPYPSQLATLLGKTVANRGVSAQRAPDIFSRWGSHPILVPALTIPASGSVDFTVSGFNGAFDQANPITDNNSAATFAGTLMGIDGTLSRVSGTYPGNYVYRFTRTSSGSSVIVPAKTPFLLTLDGRQSDLPIFWAGRNSIGLQNISGQTADQQFEAVMDWNERAISFLGPLDRRFLMLGPTNRNDEFPGSTTTVAGAALNGAASYDVIIRINDEMRQRWPRNYIDVRGLLVASYSTGVGTDDADFATDRVPGSLRSDFIHLNTTGYGIVAAAIQQRLATLGW